MRLSNRSEYAILALLFIARSKQQFVHGADISTAQNIPIKFMQQILFSLKQARLVNSCKGKSGGYALGKPSNQISLAEVVRLFDGPLAPTRSVSKYYHQETPISGEKKAIKFLKEIRDQIANKLEKTTISDLV